MKLLSEYDIPYYGLKEGVHEFDFDVSAGFFEYFENPDFTGGELKIRLKLIRESQLITLIFSISGYISVICDRCLELYNYPVKSEESVFIRFGENYEELDNNIVIIPRNEKIINIAQFIYEFTVLNLPIKRVHPDNKDGNSECDPEMLKKIAGYSKNIEKHTDPRWDILKEVL